VSKFTANRTSVRMPDGKPLCVTVHSTHLDADKNGVVGNYDKRSAWAFIIAEALNAYFLAKKDAKP
jgi:hypothetical protein